MLGPRESVSAVNSARAAGDKYLDRLTDKYLGRVRAQA